MTRAEYRRFAEKIDDHNFIFKIVSETFDTLNEWLIDEKTTKKIEIVWSNKLKTTAGTAGSGITITLSNVLWERADTAQRREVIVHETCHLVVQRRYQRNKLSQHKYFNNYDDDIDNDYRGHGEIWKNCMIACGYTDPKICHTIKPARRLFLYVCDCPGREHKIKVKLHNSYMRKEIYGLRCNICGSLCTFIKELVD